MKEEVFYEEVLRRLNVLVALQLDAPEHEKPAPVARKVQRLTDLGLSPGDIGKIVGKPSNYVAAVLATKKARRKAC